MATDCNSQLMLSDHSMDGRTGREGDCQECCFGIAPPPRQKPLFFYHFFDYLCQLHFMKNSMKFQKICNMILKEYIFKKNFVLCYVFVE
jgi:hypothetical protein